MRYLFLTADKYPPFRVDVRVLFVEELSGRGHDIDWVMASEQPRPRAGVEPLGAGRAWVGASIAGGSRVAKAVRQLQIFLHDWRALALLLRRRYDFVQVKDKFLFGAILLLAAKLTRTRFVYWLAFPFPEAWLDEAKSPVARHPWVSWVRGRLAHLLLYKVILPRCDLVFVQSEGMRRAIAAEGIAPDLMVPVPMGVARQVLDSRAGDAAAVERPAVLYLGSMVRLRHLETIVAAFRHVIAAVPRATLYFVGGENREDVDFLRAEASKLGVADKIIFTGALPREEAFAYVRAADVCLSPIYPTPILDVASPTKLVEYMAFGKPVVANEQPEQADVIAASGGGLVVPWSEERFAAAIVELLRDPARAAEMGRRGREYVERHRTYGVIAANVERAYRSHLGL